ncbi:MAG: hypothetical protein IT324_00900 [Anaerolineae bacterium]|nr:hypothetical protein [Anaerolineae bacterium]
MTSQTAGMTVALSIFFVLLAVLVAPKWKWLVVAAAGLVVALIGVFADTLDLGNHPGYGFIQYASIVIGAVVFIVALALFLRNRRRLSA